MTTKDNVHGEGNYKASREYNEATKRFTESGRVDKAAKDAAPNTKAEASEMERAEAAGRERARTTPEQVAADARRMGSQDKSSDGGASAPDSK